MAENYTSQYYEQSQNMCTAQLVWCNIPQQVLAMALSLLAFPVTLSFGAVDNVGITECLEH